MTDSAPLLVEREGGVLTLTNNDPPINRMSFEYMDALEAAVNDAESPTPTRLWPTPNAREKGGGEYQDPEKIRKRMAKGRQTNLSEAVKLWRTPNSRDYKDTINSNPNRPNMQVHLLDQVREEMWPTPRVSSANGVAQSEVDKGDPKRRLEVTVQVEQPQTTGKLNPKWVAWLMGYPTEYLNSVPWETRSSRKSQRK